MTPRGYQSLACHPLRWPYFAVDDLGEALERVRALGGAVVHPG